MALARGGKDVVVGGDGVEHGAYLAEPASGRGLGVLVVHEHWGLSDSIRDACDRLARAGFVALAPDWFEGDRPATQVDAVARADRADTARAGEVLVAGVGQLMNVDATEGARIGVVAFGVGVAHAFRLAASNARIGALVGVYGSGDAGVNLSMPVLALVAGDEAADSNPSFHSRVFDGTRAGFMNDALPDRHDAAAASEAWDALTAFLRAELV